MDPLIQKLIEQLVNTLLIPLISTIGVYLVLLLKRWIKIEERKVNVEIHNKLEDKFNQIVEKSVECVAQCYVKPLKREGNFSKSEQKEAMALAKNQIKYQLDNGGLAESLHKCELELEQAIEAAVIRKK